MADLERMKAALIAASDAADAGDPEAAAQARAIAQAIRVEMQGPSVMDIPQGAREEAARTGPLAAFGIGAGKGASEMTQGAQQALGAVPGLGKLAGGGEGLAAERAGADPAYRALVEKYPFLTAAGEIAATLPLKNPLGMAIGGALSYGTPGERVANAVAGFAGGKAGELVGAGLARLKGPASRAPTPAPPGFADFADDANRWGIPLTVGQRTGNKPAQILESVSANLPLSAGVVGKARDDTFGAFNRAVGETFGAKNLTKITPEALGANQIAIGKEIGDIAARNNIRMNGDLFVALKQAERRAMTELAPDDQKIVLNQIQNIWNAVDPSGAIPGKMYKALQSKMGALGKEKGGTTSSIFHDTRAALRDAMTASVSPEDSAAWLRANSNYFNVQQVAKATKATPGELQPNRLLSAVNEAQTQAKFGGGNELAELAQWAKQKLPDKIPNSGTAQRLFYQRLLENPLATAGALGGASYGYSQFGGDVAPEEAAAGLAAPYAVARLLAGKPASPLAKALLARLGTATGAFAATRGDPALAEALRRRVMQGEGE